MKTILIISMLIMAQNILAEDLMVYTSRKEHLVKDIFKQYQKETGVKVNYRTGKAGALIQTIKGEGAKSNADIFMTVDAGNLWYASTQGILEPTRSAILEKNIPSHLRDLDNQWFGLSVRARTIAYNPKKVKEGELISYEDLATAKWKGRLCLRTSKKVYNQSLVAMLIDQHGYTRTLEIIKGWVNNNVEIFSNDTAVLKAVAKGQCAVGIVNTYYYGRLVKKDPKLPLKLFWPNQESYGVHINVSGAGIVKTSKNKEAAKKFLEWLASKNAQRSFAQVNMEYPIMENLPQNNVVKKWGEFKANTKFNLSRAGILQKDAVKLMYEAKYK
ncbi:MAG: extracellular solute-binding protein [Oligoflexia bacterium]|nr:extracellular solute-binding protein [Oligoflexia bacterium]